MNLNEYAGKGKSLFFDCPPIYFDGTITDELDPQQFQRFILIDDKGNVVQN